MRTSFVILASILVLSVAVSAFTEREYQSHFSSFVKKFEKRYTHDQFFTKYNIFKSNLDVITEHNAKANQSYTLGINEFADMTLQEFHSKMTGYKHRQVSPSVKAKFIATPPKGIKLPASVDWRTSGAVTPVKNQGQCGSCWSFSTTGSVEGISKITTGSMPGGTHGLSEQQLVDCSQAYGNDGCNGGLMDDAFQYIEANGLCSEDSYPYKAVQGSCQASRCTSVASLSGFQDVSPGDEASMGAFVATQPVSIAIEADSQAFQFYSGGVFNDPGCGTQLDHGVLIVGYGTSNGTPYWIVKNSWGASWGEQGYIRMIRGKNECGLSNSASFPTK